MAMGLQRAENTPEQYQPINHDPKSRESVQFFFLFLFSCIFLLDFLNHALISLNNESSNIPTFFTVIDCPCISANLIVDIRIPADRTDFY